MIHLNQCRKASSLRGVIDILASLIVLLLGGSTIAFADETNFAASGAAISKEVVVKRLWTDAATAYSDGDFRGATSFCQKILAIAPQRTNALRLMGDSLYYLEDYTNAAVFYGRYAGLRTNDPYGYFWQGQALQKASNFVDSAEALKKAVRLNSTNSFYLESLGYSLSLAGSGKEAVQAYERAVALAPDSRRARRRLAREYYASGSYAKAARTFEECLAKNASDSYARYWLGHSLFQLDRYEEAAKQFREYLSKKPSNQATYWLAYCAFEQRHFKEAGEVFESALKLNPKDYQSAKMAGTSWMACLKLKRAIPLFEKARALHASRSVEMSLFACYLYTSQYQKAFQVAPMCYTSGVFFLTASLASGLFLLLRKSFRITPVGNPGIVFSICWILIYFEGQIASLFFLGFFRPAIHGETLMAGMFLSVLPLLWVTWKAFPRQSWGKAFVPEKTAFSKALLKGAAGRWLLVLILSGIYGGLIRSLTGEPLEEQHVLVIIEEMLKANRLLVFVLIAGVAPLVEEILFRGLLFGALEKRFSSKWTMVISAAAFALVHLQVKYFPPLFGLGLVMGWARQRSGSIWLSYLIHATQNGLATAVLIAGVK